MLFCITYIYAFYDKLQLRMRTHSFITEKWGDSVRAITSTLSTLLFYCLFVIIIAE